jgi:bacterioferritin
MLRDPKVIEHLNTQLTNELTAINQYFLHARLLQHWGVTKFGKHEYKESIEEIGQTVAEILDCDLKLEEKAMADLREGIAYCETVRDYVSRDLLRRILDNEEHHVDFLDRQMDLIKLIGIERYTQLNSAAAPEQEEGGGS